MTEDERRRFEDAWPGLARRLSARLAKRNVPTSMREDVVQETGLRLLEMWPRVDPRRPLWPLAVAIAGNLLWDDVNRTRRHEPVDAIDGVGAVDVEEAAIARSELTTVSKAMLQLTEGQRAALLAEVGASDMGAALSPDALKMLRMRARRRLRSLVERLPAPAALWLRSRSLLAGLGRFPEASAAVAGLGLYAAILLAVTGPGAGVESPLGPSLPGGDEPRRASAAATPDRRGGQGRTAVDGVDREGLSRGPRHAVTVVPRRRHAAARLRNVRASPLTPRGVYAVWKLGRTGPVSARASLSYSPRREPPGPPTGCNLPRRDHRVGCEVNGPRVRARVQVRIYRD
jgi:DNA-directed RNA polymerase specialized sigma24 family protein